MGRLAESIEEAEEAISIYAARRDRDRLCGRIRNPKAKAGCFARVRAKARARGKVRACKGRPAAAKRIAQIRGRIRSLRAQMRKLIGQARSICARVPKASRSACIRSLTRAPAN